MDMFFQDSIIDIAKKWQNIAKKWQGLKMTIS